MVSRRAVLRAISLTPLLAACAPAPASPTAPPSAAASPTRASQTEGELVLYSARKEELMQPVADGYVKATGARITLKSGAPGELSLLVEQEKDSPRGDALFTTDAATLETLRARGLLEAYASPRAAEIPPEFKAADGTWTGIVGRARTIIFNRNLVKESELPSSVFDLTDARWKDRVTLASIKEGGVRLWLAALIVQKGEEEALRYVKALVANGTRILPNHTEVSRAVGRGEFALGLTNHYYYTFEHRAGSPVGLHYPDQGSSDVGALVIPLGVGILRGARHPRAARAFVDHALSPEGQKPFMAQEAEFSLVPGVPLGDVGVPGVRSIDQFKRAPVTVSQLADVQEKAIRSFTPLFGGA